MTPVILLTSPATLSPAPTDTATPPPAATMIPVEGTTSTQVNVRAQPSTASNILGIIPANAKVEITGKDPGESWWEINYPPGQGVNGKGWVSAAFVQAQGVENLPIITEPGLIVGTETPTGIPFTPTPTVLPAWNDQDSSSSPSARIIFEPTGTQRLIYNGDLSSPQGDAEDWITFRTYDPFLLVSLACHGSNSVELKLLENVLPVAAYIKCNEPIHQVSVKPDSDYVIHLRAIPSTGNLQYTNYILTIQTKPS